MRCYSHGPFLDRTANGRIGDPTLSQGKLRRHSRGQCLIERKEHLRIEGSVINLALRQRPLRPVRHLLRLVNPASNLAVTDIGKAMACAPWAKSSGPLQSVTNR